MWHRSCCHDTWLVSVRTPTHTHTHTHTHTPSIPGSGGVYLVSRGGGSLRLRSIALLLGRPGISISSSKADSNSSRWCGFLTRRGFLSIVDDKSGVRVYAIRHLLCLIMDVMIMLQYLAAGAAYFRGHNILQQVAGKHTCPSDWHCSCRCRLSTESIMIKEQGKVGSTYVHKV